MLFFLSLWQIKNTSRLFLIRFGTFFFKKIKKKEHFVINALDAKIFIK